MTEGRNTGFAKILRALERNGSPKPLFETDDERTSFAATIFIHPEFSKGKFDEIGTNKVGKNQDGVISGAINGVINGVILSENEMYIMELLKQNPQMTVKILAETTDIPLRTIQRYLKGLRDNGFLVREGSRKKGKWIILI